MFHSLHNAPQRVWVNQFLSSRLLPRNRVLKLTREEAHWVTNKFRCFETEFPDQALKNILGRKHRFACALIWNWFGHDVNAEACGCTRTLSLLSRVNHPRGGPRGHHEDDIFMILYPFR